LRRFATRIKQSFDLRILQYFQVRRIFGRLAKFLAIRKGEKMPGNTFPKDGKKKKAPKSGSKKSDKKKKKK